MTQKWFWGILAFWSALGVTAVAWALILSPFREEYTRVSEFKARLNGTPTQHRIESTHLPLEESLEITSRSLLKSGWEKIQGPVPLAPLLLGVDSEIPMISPFLKIELFKKGKALMAVGFLGDRASSSRWMAEIPNAFLSRGTAEIFKDFPSKPPSTATQLFHGSWNGLEVACWSCPSLDNKKMNFSAHCRGQGFHCQFPDPTSSQGIVCIQKGTSRILALLEQNGALETVTLLYLPKSSKTGNQDLYKILAEQR